MIKQFGFFSDYLETLIEILKTENVVYANILHEVSALEAKLEIHALPYNAPFILYYEALMSQAYCEWEFFYEHGWQDCINFLKELKII